MYVLYTPSGDYQYALHYHQAELALSEGGGDKLGAGIAHRRVGECLCELGEYDRAVHHQKKHLYIARETGLCACNMQLFTDSTYVYVYTCCMYTLCTCYEVLHVCVCVCVFWKVMY